LLETDDVAEMPIELVVLPPRIFLVFLGTVLLVVLLSMFFKRESIGRKITALVIVLALLGVVAFLFYRPTVVVVDEQGLVVKRFREQRLLWTEVTEAARIADLPASEYRPVRRILGVSLGAYKAGKFRLQNGNIVQVVAQQDRDALFVGTAGDGYLFALNESDSFAEAVGRFVELDGQ
jgi:hypothetical protein